MTYFVRLPAAKILKPKEIYYNFGSLALAKDTL